MIFPSYKRPIEYINKKPYILHAIFEITRVKNAPMIKEWLGVDTVFKVNSKGAFWFCEEIQEVEWEDVPLKYNETTNK